MRAFYHPDQVLHEPQQYMRFGRVVAPKDLPERTERLLYALARHAITPEVPDDFGTGPIAAVHSPEYLDFLSTAWDRWQQLPPERGPEAWPATFPYWSGRPDQITRPPCPATGFLGQLGWYLGDLSVPVGAHLWQSARRSGDTALAGAQAVMDGADLVYALCRPSGHHARTDRASGFCYLNNTAIAAQHLLNRFERVAILDVDAHHGDGTQQIFYGRPEVLTVSIHADPDNYYPFFTGYPAERGYGEGEGTNLNLPLAHGSGRQAMLELLSQAATAIRAFGSQAIVMALGYDAHRSDPIGVLSLESEDFEAIGAAVRALRLPVLIVQEGGYAIDVIGDCLDQFLHGVLAE